MKPKILVLYYSQTGQLRQILDSILSGILDKVDVSFGVIRPVEAFPFPWSALQFFDTMPETVEHLPRPIKPFSEDILAKEYDLIILGYQPWFLNPSQPTTAFLQSEYAKVFNGKPVITVVGCRNMWLHAQEKVKEYLYAANARLVGNIVLTDTNPNLVSLLTVIRWSFKGQKQASGLLPAAGVQDKDIADASRFGFIIYKHLNEDNLIGLHHEFLMQKGVLLKPGLVVLEQRGIKNFRFWAKYIREKGGPGDPARAGRVLLFKNLLLVAIFILSPLSFLTAQIQQLIKRNSLMKDVEYFKQLLFEKGRL
jgi:flavodoxin